MGKKYVKQVAIQSFPSISPGQFICKIISSQGNNLFQVESQDPNITLVRLPKKFQNSLWIRRNSFVIVEPFISDDKINGDIITVLFEDDVKELKKSKNW